MQTPQISDLFDARYYATSCGRTYQRDEWWLQFFGAIADRIISDISPTTVLDAGCAMGFLVEALRARGVQAFGVDVSKYAIENVHPPVRAYCWVGSVAEVFPQRYDLIVSIEVLEHMVPEEAQRAIANFCVHTGDVLFSSTPFDYKEITHVNVQPPEHWAEQFARCGFVRDVDFDASFITPWAVRFRQSREPVHRVLRDYERRFWLLRKENQDLRALSLELRDHANGSGRQLAEAQRSLNTLRGQLAEAQQSLDTLREQLTERERAVRTLSLQVRDLQARWTRLEQTMGWTLLRRLQNMRARLVPPASSRDQILDAFWQGVRLRDRRAFAASLRRIEFEISQQFKVLGRRIRLRVISPLPQSAMLRVDAVPLRPPVIAHQATVDIVVCVHNALADVQRCLSSLVAHTCAPYSLILVDDGSDAATCDYLADFARAYGASLLRDEEAQGYTRAANQGLRRSAGDFVVLLNSDTIVTPGWLDRLVACAESDVRIGIVGPLSNAATWQSIPEIQSGSDWAINRLPEGMSVEEMGKLVARYSARAYPTMPFLNGFCLLIRRGVIEEVGYFDEDNFGAGYSEENDYCLRTRQAGWSLVLADDVYVYHAGSKSYTDERRKLLVERSNAALARKHGPHAVHEGSEFCRQDRVLEGIRAHSRVLFEQRDCLERGRSAFAGRRVLFLLPIAAPGGGGNVVIFKANLMREMGVEVGIFNYRGFREPFERAYPSLNIPVTYGDMADVPRIAAQYDAAVATVNTTVAWLLPTVEQVPDLIRGYFIQDFEPYFYPPDSESFKTAWASYTLIPDLVCFATTKWIQGEVIRQTGAHCGLVGGCFDLNLFRPRPRPNPEWPQRPLRIGAMIRPETHYRAPRLTMEVLRAISRRYSSKIEVLLFGTERFLDLPQDFSWRLAGRLNQCQVASLLNLADIFVDFSTYQALGITAQEAMACGAAVIVPERGGTGEFARNEENCLVVDTSSPRACEDALGRLIEDNDLRTRLQRNALFDVCAFYPERPAYNILCELFARGPS